eukprot:8571897-Karenia_brevis.AAC.1
MADGTNTCANLASKAHVLKISTQFCHVGPHLECALPHHAPCDHVQEKQCCLPHPEFEPVDTDTDEYAEYFIDSAGLLIEKGYCDLIADGRKTMELRGEDCIKYQGQKVYILEKGHKGSVPVRCLVKFTKSVKFKREMAASHVGKHCVEASEIDRILGKRTWLFGFCLELVAVLHDIHIPVRQGPVKWRLVMRRDFHRKSCFADSVDPVSQSVPQ